MAESATPVRHQIVNVPEQIPVPRPRPAGARTVRFAAVVTACAVLGIPSVGHSQDGVARAGGGGIVGAVTDAVTGAPVAGATIILQPEAGGAFPGPVVGSAFASATRAAATDGAGAYRFQGVPPGVYRIYVSRFGYRPYSVVVELRTAEARVSVGLDVEPVALDDVRARGQARGPYEAADAYSEVVDLARLRAADLRRRQYLTTDVRELTHADVVEAVTLGEPDVFRALQRLPGITTRSDYTAELWTRGAPWSHTRVYFDGIPVFNPLHALGMISGIGSSALGGVWFHPGVRSAAMAEGAAGVVDLQSRRASGGGELNAHADASLMTAGLALDQRVLDGRAGWMLSGRRTYLDWLAGLAARAGGDDADAFAYGFSEVAGRLDAWLGEGTLAEASWLWEGDHLTGEAESGDPLGSRWGNALGRATLSTRLGGLQLRHTLGASRHHGMVTTGEGATDGIPLSALNRRVSESRVDFVGLTGYLSPEPKSLAGPAWTLGYALERHAVGYFGPHALPVPRQSGWIGTSAPESWTGSGPLWWNSDLPVAAIWGETSWSHGDRLALRAGLRLEASDELANAGPFRAAPRASLRFMPAPEVALSAGVGRVYQYTQALAPSGVHMASLVSTDVWLLAGPRVPAIRSDQATAGIEAWIAPARVVTVNGFARRSAGVATPDPTPGPVFGRQTFVTGENLAYGVEASVRQLAGPVTGTLSYALTRSRMDAAGLSYPAASERPHVLDATAMVRATPELRVGAAFTAATGVPFTRTIGDPGECAVEPGCVPTALPWAGAPNAIRARTFASLDLLVDWNTRFGGTEVGVYAQLRNVLGRENGTVYTGDGPGCLDVGCAADLRNLYERGVPRLPVVGVRVRR
jgi:hypothetical protein